ncbi:KEOPS complex subunit Pcc1 [Methanohalophilus levihalophilus]|uniref:KEOPS complex subunit Pcc1 n=1 Tax=Methanohalophilus levihalophilus TaxID=1431282 RepID=UPI001AE6853B|nr:KEOPS complex subunit Pcc1 [Methanohalophilus levihalophilus]MBP2029417.1 KEOPS complex subunit Pcc1 [Methanohalophilus levihalophilus]
MKIFVKSTFETRYAETIYLTMLPELDRLVTDRSSIHLTLGNNCLILEMGAGDLVSMRSTLNTWYRLVNVAYEACSITSICKSNA